MDATIDLLNIDWASLKPILRKRWGKLTESDIAHINGNGEELIKLLRKRYGYGKAQAILEINRWLKGQKNP